MPRNFFLINLILIIVILLLGCWFYKIWVRPIDLPVQAGHQEAVLDAEDLKKSGTVDKASYDIIVRKDLFRPSRTAANIESAPTSVSAGNTPKLFGTIIKNSIKMAILEDPSSKTTKIYNVNDSVAGFRISEILQDKVILLRGDESIEVKLRDAKGIKPGKIMPVPQTARKQRPKPRRTTRRRLPRPADIDPDLHN